jgi:MerR family mercuric resistance operon transcriptional regulator
MAQTSPCFAIGALAQRCGVGVETIRYYQRRGLLAEPDRPYGGIRRYGPADVARVRFVRRAQQLGFNLDEAAELLRLDDGTHCADARSLGEAKLADVRRKLEDLRHMEQALAALVQRCGAARGKLKCPLIAGLQAGAGGPAA